MDPRNGLYSILILLFVIPVSSFSSPAYPKTVEDATNQPDIYSHPIQVDGLTLKEYRAGTSQREIYSEQATFAQAEKYVLLIKPRFILFDQQGNKKTILTCEKSQINLDKNQVDITGKVNLKINTGIKFQTEHLIWDTAQKKFFTDGAVEIIKDNNTLRGIGLEADENFEQIQILHFVAKGSRSDFGKESPNKK